MRETVITAFTAIVDAVASVKHVTREDARDILSAAQFPCVVITDNGNERIEYKTGGLADVYISLELEIQVEKSTGQSTSLNAVDTDVKAAIAANPTLTGTVSHVTIRPQNGGDTHGDDNIASRKRVVDIFYEASTASGL